MATLIDTIPQALKVETVRALHQVYSQFITPESLALQEKFHLYEDLIRDEVEDYINRRDGVVTEIDVILEEERAKKRIGDEFPQAKVLMEKFKEMALQKRRGEYEVKQVFLAKNGTAAQFDALRDVLGANPRPWWAPKPA